MFIRWVLAVAIVLLAGADGAVIVARRSAEVRRARSAAPAVTAPVTVAAARAQAPAPEPAILFADDFSPGTLFQSSESPGRGASTADGRYRMWSDQRVDIYTHIPTAAPERPAVEAARDVSVAVDVRNRTGDFTTWAGVYCRSGGLDGDLYAGTISPGGAWSIVRATLGTLAPDRPYRRIVLASGHLPGLVSAAPDTGSRVRLDCVGDSPTVLRLRVGGVQVGEAQDPSGIGPGSAGLAVSAVGEVVFDNLEVRAAAPRSLPSGVVTSRPAIRSSTSASGMLGRSDSGTGSITSITGVVGEGAARRRSSSTHPTAIPSSVTTAVPGATAPTSSEGAQVGTSTRAPPR